MARARVSLEARALDERFILISSQSRDNDRDRNHRSSFFSHPPTPKNRSDQRRREEDELEDKQERCTVKTEKQKKRSWGLGNRITTEWGGLYPHLESNNQKQFRDSLTSAGALEGALGEFGGPWDLVTRRFRILIHL